jgi:hypothetical protein
MRTTQSNGRRRQVNPRIEQRDGFWPILEHGLAVCSRCAALVPASDRAQQRHRTFHEQVDGIDQR